MIETWRAAYRMMQHLGIEFECQQISGGWYPTKMEFNEEQRRYRIAPDQTPPENWRYIYAAAQILGVEFDFSRDFSYAWVNNIHSFNGEFNQYRLHVEEPQKRTIEINGRKLPAPVKVRTVAWHMAAGTKYGIEAICDSEADAEAFKAALEGKK